MKRYLTKLVNNFVCGMIVIGIIVTGLGFSGQIYASAVEFRYSGDNGPGFWGELSPDWGECAGTASGARQSPIDIGEAETDPNLKPLNLKIYATIINVFNNGHTIEQEYQHTGSSIVFSGHEYELQQFHFHSLSEHVLDNKRAVLELHAVFTEPVGGNHLVVGVLFEIGSDQNQLLQTLIEAGLPRKNGDRTETNTSINLSDGLTDTKEYYTYKGSLTTPPCTENVTWIVLKDVAELSQFQWASFRSILGNNFRPTQTLNDRVVNTTPEY